MLSLEMWAECGTLNGPEHRLKAGNPWTTFLLSYLWLMPLTNTFPCCFWHRTRSVHFPDSTGSTVFYCQRRPSCPRDPQPTSARVKEMALISFHFSHIKWGKRKTSVCRTWPSWINKLGPQSVRAYVQYESVCFEEQLSSFLPVTALHHLLTL